ncbi:MAG: FHA domain-containing protein [Nocardioides sp.]
MTELEATAARRSFRPGSWYAVLGERATVLLPPSEKARVAALWELVDDGAGFDEVLDALVASGLRDLPGFVLVSASEGTTQIVLRGAARATFTADGEEVALDGSTAATWVERALTGVTRTVIEVEDAEGGDLGLDVGLVRVARVDEPAYTPPETAPDETGVEGGDVEGGAESGVESEDLTGFETPTPKPEPEPEPAAPDPELTERFPAPTPIAAWPPVEPPAAEPAGAEHDGLTLAGKGEPEEFALQQPGIPGQQFAPSVTSRPVAKLVLSNGEAVEVDRAVLVGRAPEARRFASNEQPRLVTVPSPQQEISSTHLEVRPGSGADHGSAVVTDLGSTNGTVLVQPGLPPEDLQPGIAVQLIPGAIIDLGDGVTIQVTNP